MHNFAVKRGVWRLMAASLCLTMLAPSAAAVPKGYGLSPAKGDASVSTAIPKGYGLHPEKGDAPISTAIPEGYELHSVGDTMVSTLRPEVCPEENPTPLPAEEAPAIGQENPAVEQPEETPAPPSLTSATEKQLQDRAAKQLRGRGLSQAQNEALSARLVAQTALLVLLEQGELTTADLVYLALPNGRPDRLDRYSTWSAGHPEDPPEAVVLHVNMDQDCAFYENIETVLDPDSLSVLVNKNHILPDGYVPELEALGYGYGSGSLRPEAAQAFRTMADAARKDGISLHSVSAYRSYTTQQSTYNRYLKYNRQAVVDTFSARPGHSEHQTGLALDINTANVQAHFENTPAYAWLKEHCAEYGFTLRYLQGKEAVTGYRFEPWHYRYVGAEAAKVCMDQGITYEEYLALQPA